MITLDDPKLQNISPENLGELLISAKKAYYTTGKPIMDDHTYDTLEEILRKELPYHRIFNTVGNPNFDTGFVKKKHIIPMGSQNKVTSLAELSHYFELKKITKDTEFVVEPKCDGISLEIIYQNGQLVEAVTRGDGKIGDVVTQNVVKMQNFVSNPRNFSGSIRCEIVVTKKDFDQLNQISEEKYSNPRNAASGLTQRLDSKYSEYCTLMAVDCSAPVDTEIDKIDYLRHLKFTPVESWNCQSFEDIESIFQDFFQSKRLDYPFEIDGLVIKINSLALQHKLGEKNGRPKGQVAYKFPAQSNITRIVAIDWQVGPLGSITPVAQIDPIELSGAMVTYASLANYDLVKQFSFNVNDIVSVSRRGDVIPHIENVITKITPGHILPPNKCPSCQSTLIVGSKFIHCPNNQCPDQVLGRLRLFCDTLEIKGISDKTIAKLYHASKLKLPGDFFLLQPSDIASLENLGEKSAKNIIHQIQSKKELSIVEVFDSAIIPHFSTARIKQLVAAGFDTPQKILNLTTDDLLLLPGFKITLADKIIKGIRLRLPEINSILSNITLSNSRIQNPESKINGLTFCITGDLSHPRKQVTNDIENAGGKVVSSVSSNTSYLVTNEIESKSSKYVTAKKLNIPIITEEKLYQMIRD